MHTLPFEKKAQVAAALVDGVSIRAAERLLDVHRDTIMRLGVTVGEACARLHDARVRDVRATLIQADELWTFVQKKQRRLRQDDPREYGDQYVFLAMDAVSKLILSYRVGKRTGDNADAFAQDLRLRVLGRPQISTDAWNGYPEAISRHFGADVDFGTVDKDYTVPQAQQAALRYSPGKISRVTKTAVLGDPAWGEISTSYSERLNLSVRVSLKRFARLTISHSKRLRNLEAAVGLFVAHFNFCRVHETLRCTPAMEAGLTDHVWSIAELLHAAFEAPEPTAPAPIPAGSTAAQAKGERRGSFRGPRGPRPNHLRVIKGGLS